MFPQETNGFTLLGVDDGPPFFAIRRSCQKDAAAQ